MGIRRLVERDLAAFFGALNLSRPEVARDALMEFVPALVERYGSAAAAMAAEWYDEYRAEAGVRGRFRALPITPDESAATLGTVRRAAGHLFTDDPTAALLAISAKAAKYALAAARRTVTASSIADPASGGWQRVTRPGSCRFCLMLAGRGAVYRRETADFASHDDCNCAAKPSWDKNAPEVDVRLYEASKRTSNMSPEQHERHTQAIREVLDRYVPED